MTQIHLCTAGNAPALHALLDRFAEEYGLDTQPEARHAALAPLLDGSPYGMAYLLGPARAPVGYVVVTLGWSLELGGQEAFIDEIFIRPSVRGRGLAGEALLAIGRALGQAGVRAIHLEVLRDDPGHHRLYEKAGFRLRDRYCLMTRTL